MRSARAVDASSGRGAEIADSVSSHILHYYRVCLVATAAMLDLAPLWVHWHDAWRA